ncbi:hypothetical protein [Pseudomonas aeruginosa]|uniref:hypothetical protein n=1 Tax=Pseudomonas aeruginosa TaxID=287 RepID=UPI0023312454|nr:hypothetical protein [Pseudomonas aeruginosa]
MSVQINGFYAREITVFSTGIVVGMAIMLIYLWLIKNGYERLGWMFVATVASVVATLFVVSRILRDGTDLGRERGGEVEADRMRDELARYKAVLGREVGMTEDDLNKFDFATGQKISEGGTHNELSDEGLVSNIFAGSEPIGGSAPMGLTFPYATKALEAARCAAIKYWLDYEPSSVPLQKVVTSFIVERGVPNRQAQELANAIKPDALKSSDTSI